MGNMKSVALGELKQGQQFWHKNGKFEVTNLGHPNGVEFNLVENTHDLVSLPPSRYKNLRIGEKDVLPRKTLVSLKPIRLGTPLRQTRIRKKRK